MGKVDYKTGRYSKALIDRIDGIVDEKEFDPYKAGKKLEASGEEMFDNNMYADDDKEELTEDDIDEASNSMKIVAAVFISIALIAATVLIISNIL